MTITEHDISPDCDHVIVKLDGEFVGFRGRDSKRICVQRCFKCHRENYALAVLSGACAWCGWDANAPAP